MNIMITGLVGMMRVHNNLKMVGKCVEDCNLRWSVLSCTPLGEKLREKVLASKSRAAEEQRTCKKEYDVGQLFHGSLVEKVVCGGCCKR